MGQTRWPQSFDLLYVYPAQFTTEQYESKWIILSGFPLKNNIEYLITKELEYTGPGNVLFISSNPELWTLNMFFVQDWKTQV